MRGLIIFLTMLPVSAQVYAQDFIPYVEIQAANIQYGNMLEKMYDRRDNPNNSSNQGAVNGQPQRPTYAAAASARSFAMPAPASAARIDFSYRSTPALRRSAADAYVQRTMQNNPEAGHIISDQLAKHDFSKVYAGIIAPFGYRADDTADAVAAYTLLGWLISTGAPDPSAGAARAVRNQIAQGLRNGARLSDPRARAELAEEMKLLFVTLHSGWQSARREGKLKQYSDGVNDMFRKFTDNNLRNMRLTDRGFVRA